MPQPITRTWDIVRDAAPTSLFFFLFIFLYPSLVDSALPLVFFLGFFTRPRNSSLFLGVPVTREKDIHEAESSFGLWHAKRLYLRAGVYAALTTSVRPVEEDDEEEKRKKKKQKKKSVMSSTSLSPLLCFSRVPSNDAVIFMHPWLPPWRPSLALFHVFRATPISHSLFSFLRYTSLNTQVHSHAPTLRIINTGVQERWMIMIWSDEKFIGAQSKFHQSRYRSPDIAWIFKPFEDC